MESIGQVKVSELKSFIFYGEKEIQTILYQLNYPLDSETISFGALYYKDIESLSIIQKLDFLINYQLDKDSKLKFIRFLMEGLEFLFFGSNEIDLHNIYNYNKDISKIELLAPYRSLAYKDGDKLITLNDRAYRGGDIYLLLSLFLSVQGDIESADSLFPQIRKYFREQVLQLLYNYQTLSMNSGIRYIEMKEFFIRKLEHYMKVKIERVVL